MGEQHDSRDERLRQPHVVMDRGSRVHKARKIVALVGEKRFQDARRILEIGCGSGVIAATLAELGGESLEVHAVDVVDSRIETEGYSFQLVNGTDLPFADGTFDIVISNHVIEHVGPRRHQIAHLREIHRLLAPSGLGYLAVPNKWRLVEPHFRLPLLSWWPQQVADRYVRLAGRGSHYDCLPLSAHEAHKLFHESGFESRDATVAAFHATVRIEFPPSGLLARAARLVPGALLRFTEFLMPTFIFLLRPRRP